MVRRNTGRGVALLAALVLAATTQVAVQSARTTPAAAAVNAQLATQRSVYDSNNKSATATCPAGSSVVGGGGRIVDGDGFVIMSGAYPVSAQSYRVAAHEIAGGYGAAWELHAFAICTAPPDDYQIVEYTDSAATAYPLERKATANCPFGTDVLGVGARLNNYLGQESLQKVQPYQDYVEAVGVGVNAGDVTVTAYAICAEPPAGYEIAFNPTFPYTGRVLQVGVVCPSSKTVLSAGLGKYDANGVSHADGMFPSTDLRRVWTLTRKPSADPNQPAASPDQINLAAWAVCAN